MRTPRQPSQRTSVTDAPLAQASSLYGPVPGPRAKAMLDRRAADATQMPVHVIARTGKLENWTNESIASLSSLPRVHLETPAWRSSCWRRWSRR